MDNDDVISTDRDKFVCLIVRDREYLEKTYPGRNWSYHNFRDTNVENYREAVIALVEKGYFVFRMGKIQEKINEKYRRNKQR